MGKAPAFQFYAADFISDSNVVMMSLAERGAYITLLCHCWIEGWIPDDVGKLARLCGTDSETMASLWRTLLPRFQQRDGDPMGTLCNPRMEEVRKKQEEYREMQREHGFKGAKKRWDKRKGKYRVRHSNPNGETMAKEDRRLKAEDEEEIGVKRKEKSNLNADFDAFWAAYPVKVNPSAAARVWHERRKDGSLPPLADLLAAIKRHQKSDQWTRDGGKAIPHAVTWLVHGRWVDDYDVKVMQKQEGGHGSGHAGQVGPKRSGRYYEQAGSDADAYRQLDIKLGLTEPDEPQPPAAPVSVVRESDDGLHQRQAGVS